jgi:hypothetical protein
VTGASGRARHRRARRPRPCRPPRRDHRRRRRRPACGGARLGAAVSGPDRRLEPEDREPEYRVAPTCAPTILDAGPGVGVGSTGAAAITTSPPPMKIFPKGRDFAASC